jgi:hypothetical protein
MQHPAAPLLAADLGRLPHTNGRGEKGFVHIPGFITTTGMSQEQAGEVGLLALAIAEGVIEDLQSHGYPVQHETQIQARINAATAQKPTPEDITLECNRCHRPAVKVKAADRAKVNVTLLVAGLTVHAETCR